MESYSDEESHIHLVGEVYDHVPIMEAPVNRDDIEMLLSDVVFIEGRLQGTDPAVISRNSKQFQEKCQKVRDNAAHIPNIQWVIDWDRTATRVQRDDGSKIPSAFGVLEYAPWVPEKYLAKFQALHDYILPLEFDPSVPCHVKSKLLLDWSATNQKTLTEIGVDQERLREACVAAKVEFRRGFLDHISDIVRHQEQHIVIYSAGISDVIEELLKLNGHSLDHTDVLGNRMVWQNGRLTGWSSPIITPDNKCSHQDAVNHARSIPLNSTLIAVGDSVHDVGMMSPYENGVRSMLSVGIFNYEFPPQNPKDLARLRNHLDAFDVVITRSDSWEFLVRLSRQLGASDADWPR